MSVFPDGFRLATRGWFASRRMATAMLGSATVTLALLPFTSLVLRLQPWTSEPPLHLPYACGIAWLAAALTAVALIPAAPEWETRRARVRAAQCVTWWLALVPTFAIPMAVMGRLGDGVADGGIGVLQAHLFVAGVSSVLVSVGGGVAGGLATAAVLTGLVLLEQATGTRHLLPDLTHPGSWSWPLLSLLCGSLAQIGTVGCSAAGRRLDSILLR